MKLGHVELFVRDPAASRDFYERVLGFEVTSEQPGGFVWLRCGDAAILLRPGAPAPSGAAYREASSALVLYTENRPETLAKLLQRGLWFHGTDGADTCLTFRDPDGHWWQLVDPKEV